jgi:hypothetical protein
LLGCCAIAAVLVRRGRCHLAARGDEANLWRKPQNWSFGSRPKVGLLEDCESGALDAQSGDYAHVISSTPTEVYLSPVSESLSVDHTNAARFGARCVIFEEGASGILAPVRGVFDDKANPILNIDQAADGQCPACCGRVCAAQLLRNG